MEFIKQELISNNLLINPSQNTFGRNGSEQPDEFQKSIFSSIDKKVWVNSEWKVNRNQICK